MGNFENCALLLWRFTNYIAIFRLQKIQLSTLVWCIFIINTY